MSDDLSRSLLFVIDDFVLCIIVFVHTGSGSDVSLPDRISWQDTRGKKRKVIAMMMKFPINIRSECLLLSSRQRINKWSLKFPWMSE
jgi:hypothetical protein